MGTAVRRRSLASVAAIVVTVVCGTGAAQAGGFAVREQSAFGQGASFAGIAAGGAPSAMFWNPATMTQSHGLTFEGTAALLLPHSVNTPMPGSTLLALGGSGNIGDTALVPSTYAIWQATPDVWLGLSINAPFGLSVSPPAQWAGLSYARDTDAKSYNFTPSIAMRVNDMLSVGFGVQIQYMTVDFNSGVAILPAGANNIQLEGNGFGFGVTAGLTFTPTPTTQIGLGWRSAINQDLEGTLFVPAAIAPISTAGAIETKARLPDIVSLSIRQRIGATPWTLLGTVEWANWSRIGTSDVLQPGGLPALAGGTPVRLPFEYEDGWFYSIGAEYAWSPALALRAGLGFETSPITDRDRTPRIPDNDRTWLSIGASYNWNERLSFDIAYTHIFVKDANINITAASGNPWFAGVDYIGTAESHLNIFSVGLRYRWFDSPRPALVTKG